MDGTSLGPYEIVGKLGSGGMGEVYRARDTRLGRDVAIKMLPTDLGDKQEEALERLRREALMLAALNHPNVATIHAIEEGPEGPFLVLEHVDGDTLTGRLNAREGEGLPPDEAIDICAQVARGIAAAHERGIVHRDVKPANVLIGKDGIAKVLDFGIGKSMRGVVFDTGETAIDFNLTNQGVLVGTVPYMSPEAVKGGEVDERSDIWAFGCVLYESLTGRSPFMCDSAADTLAAILEQEPAPVPEGTAPAEVLSLVRQCLSKSPAQRPASMRVVADQLASAAEPVERAALSRAAQSWKWLAGGAAAIAILAALAAWFAFHQLGVRWATDEALPEINELIAAERFAEAVPLAEQAERYIGGSPELDAVWPLIARDVHVTATPTEARVSISAVRRPEYVGDSMLVGGEWVDLGRTPIELERLPLGSYRVRVEEPGFQTRELIERNPAPTAAAGDVGAGAAPEATAWHLVLAREGRVPDDMVMLGPKKLRANLRGLEDHDPQPSADRNTRYLLGKHEVTNADYKRFVDGGGYDDPQYWQHSFVRQGVELSFGEAMAELLDTTGRPGPATWEAGTFPVGDEDLPVTGLSWFEAAAYAEFAGASLPTIYHWLGGKSDTIDMSLFGNFRGQGPLPVGSTEFGPFGIYDLAGNVREWTDNAAGELRFILGGGWSDPGYTYHNGDLAPPWDRSPRNGVRLADLGDVPEAELEALRAPVVPEVVSRPWGESPASDEVFAAYAARYAYDPLSLDPIVGAVDASSPYWTKETVTFADADGERMTSYLFLPKNVEPPYQTLLFFPGAGTIAQLSSETLQGMDMIEHVVRSGRAVVYPVYTSTYERFDGVPNNARSRSQAYLARKAQWIQDTLRALDYLETRGDVDPARTGYWGLSWGAEIAPITLAIDDRPRAAVLMDAGALLVPVLPEADEANFVPRVTVPVLMINGRYDYIYPVETAQEPFFELLGTPEDQKTHVLFDAGHVAAATRFDEVMEVMVNWLDEVFGPVR